MKKKLLFVASFIILLMMSGILYHDFSTTNYSKLENFLAAGNWEAANEETSWLILKVSRRRWFGSITDLLGQENSLKRFPCKDLSHIDSLWFRYSNGHFGLSIQQNIFQSLQIENFNGDWFSLYESFFEDVGWQNIEKADAQPTFSLHAPLGHLPSPDWMIQAGGVGKSIPWIMNGIYLYQRIEECESSYAIPSD